MSFRVPVVAALSVSAVLLVLFPHHPFNPTHPPVPKLSYRLLSESGRGLRSVFEGLPAEKRFIGMGQVSRKSLPCKARSTLKTISEFLSVQTVHAQDDGCTGAYWTAYLVPCIYYCIVDDNYPQTYTDSTVAGPCDGHELFDGYCGACDLSEDTPWCDSCSS